MALIIIQNCFSHSTLLSERCSGKRSNPVGGITPMIWIPEKESENVGGWWYGRLPVITRTDSELSVFRSSFSSISIICTIY